MRTAIARIAKGVLPQRSWTYLQSVRSRNRQVRWLKENGVLELGETLFRFQWFRRPARPFCGDEISGRLHPQPA